MRNIALVLEYDGTGLSGFQRQAEQQSHLTVQGALEEAIRRVTGETVRVIGAGRTDAGVHAVGQVANFRCQSQMPVERLPLALNAHLPRQIVVREAFEVPVAFHARFHAAAKVYRYLIWNRRVISPFWGRYAWHIPVPLDVTAMAVAAERLVGRHDFRAFRASGSSVRSSVRTVYRCQVGRQGPWVVLTVEADGFLYHMVRIMAGTLVEVGRGRQPPGWVAEVLASGNRDRAGPTAPAHGLWLVKVKYLTGAGVPAYNEDRDYGWAMPVALGVEGETDAADVRGQAGHH